MQSYLISKQQTFLPLVSLKTSPDFLILSGLLYFSENILNLFFSILKIILYQHLYLFDLCLIGIWACLSQLSVRVHSLSVLCCSLCTYSKSISLHLSCCALVPEIRWWQAAMTHQKATSLIKFTKSPTVLNVKVFTLMILTFL